jgi:glycerate kinase
MKKYVVCPDSFKGSLSADLVALAIEKGILLHDGSATVIKAPIADGGEGTLDALVPKNERISLSVRSTDGSPVLAQYGKINDTAVIEMATAAGLCLVKEENRDPERASTYGVGELILDALDRGFKKIMITVGGSGTNDGGSGLIEALGARFYDKDGNLLSASGGALAKIERIDISSLDERLRSTEFIFACDVKNPLVGDTGATRIYGAQKGADEKMLDRLEAGMINYADKLAHASGRDVRNTEGCGAGGGTPASLLALGNARIESGIDSVLSAIGFDEMLRGADLVITGEGKIDRQSAYGKAISGVAKRAKAKNIPVLVLVGAKGEGADELASIGVTRIAAISSIAPSVDYSIGHADELLEKLVPIELSELGM